MKPFEMHHEVFDDLRQAADFYDRGTPPTGRRFLMAVDDAIQKLLFDPTARTVLQGEVRRQPVDDFPYHILFIDEPHRVWIVGVAHYSRKTAYWLNRL